MKIVLNGNELNFTLENEKTAGQVLESLEQVAEENNATIVHISINDTVIPAESIDSCYDMPLDAVQVISVTTVQEQDVYDFLKDLVQPVEQIAAKMEQIPVLLQMHKDGEVAETLKKFADIFDSMCHLATLTCLFPQRFDALSFSSLRFDEYLKDFAPILNQFEEALKSGDTVLTGDLAEWELKPRLDQFIATVKDFN